LSIGRRGPPATTLFIILRNEEGASLEKDIAGCHMTGADDDPISGLRAACTKLIKTNFAPAHPNF